MSKALGCRKPWDVAGLGMSKAWAYRVPGDVECPGMSKDWECRRSGISKAWGCRVPGHAKSLVILSAAKDLRSEASGLPDHPADHRATRAGHAEGCASPRHRAASAPHRPKDPSGSALRMTPGGVPSALACRRPCYAESLSCRRPRHAKSLVILSAAKDLACRTAGRPSGHSGRPGSRMRVARQILRPSASG